MKDGGRQKLIFIYNADSGLLNMVFDGAHKIFSPSTYKGRLCDITFDTFTENNGWKQFRNTSTLEMEFLHKVEFLKAYRSKFLHKYTFPIVLSANENGLEVFVKTEELNEINNVEGLIRLIEGRKSSYFETN